MQRGLVVCVVGTRPEAVKLAPIVLALKDHPRLAPLLVSTGQHRELVGEALADFALAPDIDLELMRVAQRPVDLLAAALPRLADLYAARRPAAVVVQGDTISALAAAQAAALTGTPLVHVEAGLRSGDVTAPFPEEHNRRLIAQLADRHFAPTSSARDALLREGIAADTIEVTGNTGIDALRIIEHSLDTAGDKTRSMLPRLDAARPLLVVTAHRRENHGAPLVRIAAALAELAVNDGVEIVLPVHPHPAVEAAFAPLASVPYIHLVPPLSYPAFIGLLRRATAVLTDSGGVQEEAPALGVPALVLRDVTERDEGLATGNARLVGTETATIVAATRALLDDRILLARMSEPALPYGAGHAAPRIVASLDRLFGRVQARAELFEYA
ncbi:non-hydrolyzing UDP-N-acetylglucosamine 2-epimerase [Glacieibacterium frigidum]|uniref:UDP-N-acetylglucosamine 2-epimerase (non-hydrolyzing) n=1 Tax=Glacieibacterium frigidum TaxID=2593303 RepID=A0A552U9H5_9SPHN|nr:UDP-N-acetylglucosamine 2-epimerase (non-hydrolyzing) [Glacieibacterium frigidum]TRW14866.1 UDP-N-acetylglucosamine 2-epimerase (non-hydrolyzing) [Glacieibacterium frigidum]